MLSQVGCWLDLYLQGEHEFLQCGFSSEFDTFSRCLVSIKNKANTNELTKASYNKSNIKVNGLNLGVSIDVCKCDRLG